MSDRFVQNADDKSEGMTLDELAAFVQKAMRMDAPGDSKVLVSNGFRRQIQALEVNLP